MKRPKKRAAPAAAGPKADRVHAYARAVVAGKIVAGRLVKLACQRHLNDLKDGPKRGLVWREPQAEAVLTFFEEVLFLEEGKPFKLDEFQAFIVGNLLGWWMEDPDGIKDKAGKPNLIRRFRYFYAEIGKGNGKTPLMAGLSLYFLVFALDPSPEVYSAAAATEQAKICFDDARQMVEASPELKKKIVVLTHSMTIPSKNAKFLVLSSEAKSKHGKRVSFGGLDEIHAHNSAKVVRTMMAGTKNCKNALIAMITNSGNDRRSICWKHHETGRRMLEGEMRMDNLFAYICGLDPCPRCTALQLKQPDPKCPHCDDWKNRKNWPKANPGMGTICRESYLAERVQLARDMPSEMNDVLQLNLCQWTESASGWANMSQWDNACRDEKLKLEQFKGRRAWIGMDAANKVDVTSLVLVVEREEGGGVLDPGQLEKAAREALEQSVARVDSEQPDPETPENGPTIRSIAAAGYATFAWHFVPEQMVTNQSQENHEAYTSWRDTGKLVVTEGAVTDFSAIAQKLKFLARLLNVQRLQYDPRELGYFMDRVRTWANFEVVEVGQGPSLISQPMKELEALIASGLIKHDGDPVLRWMIANVVQKTTSSGPMKYYFPTRQAEAKKIDGAVGLIMAVDGALRMPAPAQEPSVMFV